MKIHLSTEPLTSVRCSFSCIKALTPLLSPTKVFSIMPVSLFRTCIYRARPEPLTSSPLGITTRWLTEFSVLNSLSISPVSRFHFLIEQSREPLTRTPLPLSDISGRNARHHTTSVCPCNTCIVVPADKFQTRIVLSDDPLAIRPFERSTRANTQPVCPLRRLGSVWPFRSLQMRISP